MTIDLSNGVSPVSTRVMNLAHFLTQSAQRHPDEIGFVWGDRSWTWAEMEARSAAFAAALGTRYGLRKGDRVLVQSRNCNQMLEAMFACFRLGAVWVPANFRGTPDDLAWMAELSGAKLLICDAAFPDHAAIPGPALATRLAIGAAPFGTDLDAVIDRHGAPRRRSAPSTGTIRRGSSLPPAPPGDRRPGCSPKDNWPSWSTTTSPT